jgi:hypothetical protein
MLLKRFPYQMIFVSLHSYTVGLTRRAGTANPSGAPDFSPGVKWVHVAQFAVFCLARLSGVRTHNLVVIATDCIDSYKSNCHTITTMTFPKNGIRQCNENGCLFVITIAATI